MKVPLSLIRHFKVNRNVLTELIVKMDDNMKPGLASNMYNYLCRSMLSFWQARMATEEEVLLCHGQEWLETLRRSAEMSEEQLMDLSSKYDGIFFNQVRVEQVYVII